jgi:general stress protein YciG
LLRRPFFISCGNPDAFEETGMSMTVSEAGRRGGLALLREKGRPYFVEIGKKGQAALRAHYPNMAREWGKKGGRPRRPKLDNGGEGAKNSMRGG